MNRRLSSAKNVRRAVVLMMLTALFCLAALSVRAVEPTQELRQARLRLLYSDSLFLNVNRNDGLAAIKTWVEAMGRRRGYQLAVEIGFYDRVEETTARIREKTVDMITCTSLEYLQLTPTGQIEPVFSPGWYQVSDEYVMLTRRDRHFTTLADLRGKGVVFYRTGAGLGRLWVDASLGEHGLGSVNDFFGSNSEAPKVSSVILPLFFGKTDAAVVKRYGWETMKEMNPQLAVQLQILSYRSRRNT
jgi:ABC-type phosphate/phosphonate transport system substrate-binding protein